MLLLLVASAIFWIDPGDIAAIDFSKPARAVAPPVLPLTFLEEDKSGTSPKVLARDSADIVWHIKGGPEARAESFATRLVSALGYYADSVIFIQQGSLQNTPRKLGRASGFISSDGSFTWAGFEHRDPQSTFLPNRKWRWNDLHNKEIHGLQILVMLLSNWDNKDARNFIIGSNTGYIETPEGLRAYVTDWGQSLGAWGGRFAGRSHWDCEAFRRQTPRFIRGTRKDRVLFNYVGQHTMGFANDVTLEDVRWLMGYLGQVTDEQIRAALTVSGATDHERQCFTDSLRKRIEALRHVAALR